MKRRRKATHDNAAQTSVLGAAQAEDTGAGSAAAGQLPITFENEKLPMTASPHDDVTSTADSGLDTDAPAPASLTEPAADSILFQPAEPAAGRELFAMPADAQPESGLGLRLRTARTDRGWSVDDVAAKLRLPQRLIVAIESDDHARIHDVYLRGYLVSYARLVGVPVEAVDSVVAAKTQAPPPLVATGRMSHSRWLFERYSVPAVYLLLTGLIVGPSIWLATHGGLERNLARFAPLDATSDGTPAPNAPVRGTDLPPPVASSSVEGPLDQVGVAPAAERHDAPLMASVAPILQLKPDAPAAAAPVAAPAAVAGSGAHRLYLKLAETSWVEVLGGDGRRLEYGLLPAGSERNFASDEPISVRLGNSVGAQVSVDGAPLDLAPYRRANVAYFKVFERGSSGASTPQ